MNPEPTIQGTRRHLRHNLRLCYATIPIPLTPFYLSYSGKNVERLRSSVGRPGTWVGVNVDNIYAVATLTPMVVQ